MQFYADVKFMHHQVRSYTDTHIEPNQIGCQNPGYIYMTDDAVDAFKKGKRIFRYATNVSQVQLKDNSPKKIIMDSKLLK